MTTPWTPPRGFFPNAYSWFHPGNIARYEPVFRRDFNCDFRFGPARIYAFDPPCDGSAIGLNIHGWYGDPISWEHWGTITGCQGDEYLVSGIPAPAQPGITATIGTGVPATIHDFWAGAYSDAGLIHPMAIRYGWLFSDLAVSWWQHEGAAIHWLGPP